MTIDTDQQRQTRNKRTGLAVGLTAGLLGGAAAGLVVGVPGLSSAADDDAPAAVVLAQTDDTSGSDTTDTSGDDTARPEPGARVREMLQELVDDGTITAEQADAVATHLVENSRFGEGRGGHGRGGHGPLREISPAVTDLLGIDAETLREQLRDGATLAEVAEAQGVSVDDLVAVLVAEATERIDAAVADGRLDAAEAEEKQAELTERITERVNNGRPDRGQHGEADAVDAED